MPHVNRCVPQKRMMAAWLERRVKMQKPGAVRLLEMLSRNHHLAAKVDEDDFPLAAFDCLQSWQQNRLSVTFGDLICQDAYRPAVNFFLAEIYGGLDFRERDQDMQKVMPVMKRFLPDKVLYIMSEAFELQAISLEFDLEMARQMRLRGWHELDIGRYCEVYLAGGNREGRERQILLIRKLGYDLEKLVDKPLVNALVRLLRGPAHAAGFGKLQEFLEAGLGSFRAMDDIGFFNETIYQREWNSMESLFAGEEDPFDRERPM